MGYWFGGIFLALVVAGLWYKYTNPLVLASPIEGRVLTGDETPVAGVTVVRSWNWAWNGKTGEDVTTTDDEGRFSFGDVTGNSFSALVLPHQPSVRTQIHLRTQSEDRLVLSLMKNEYDLGSEARTAGREGVVLKVRCYSDREAGGGNLYWGTCVWDD